MSLTSYRVTLIHPDGRAEESFEGCWADRKGVIAAIPDDSSVPDWTGPGMELVAAKDGSVEVAFTVTRGKAGVDLSLSETWRVYVGTT